MYLDWVYSDLQHKGIEEKWLNAVTSDILNLVVLIINEDCTQMFSCVFFQMLHPT